MEGKVSLTWDDLARAVGDLLDDARGRCPCTHGSSSPGGIAFDVLFLACATLGRHTLSGRVATFDASFLARQPTEPDAGVAGDAPQQQQQLLRGSQFEAEAAAHPRVLERAVEALALRVASESGRQGTGCDVLVVVADAVESLAEYSARMPVAQPLAPAVLTRAVPAALAASRDTSLPPATSSRLASLAASLLRSEALNVSSASCNADPFTETRNRASLTGVFRKCTDSAAEQEGQVLSPRKVVPARFLASACCSEEREALRVRWHPLALEVPTDLAAPICATFAGALRLLDVCRACSERSIAMPPVVEALRELCTHPACSLRPLACAASAELAFVSLCALGEAEAIAAMQAAARALSSLPLAGPRTSTDADLAASAALATVSRGCETPAGFISAAESVAACAAAIRSYEPTTPSQAVLKCCADAFAALEAACDAPRDSARLLMQRAVPAAIGIASQLRVGPSHAGDVLASALVLAHSACRRRVDALSFEHFATAQLPQTLVPLVEWAPEGDVGAAAASELFGLTTEQSVLAGVNYVKSTVFNVQIILGKVAAMIESGPDRARVVLAVASSARSLLARPLTDQRIELFMQIAAPLAIDLVSGGAPDPGDITKILTTLVTRLDGGGGSRLMQLNFVYDTLRQKFPGSEASVRALMRALVRRGRRDDVRALLDAGMRPRELVGPRNSAVLECLVATGARMHARLRTRLLNALALVIAAAAPRPGDDLPRHPAVVAAVDAAMAELGAACARQGGPTEADVDRAIDQVTRATLFQALFAGDVREGCDVAGEMRERIPGDVATSAEAMSQLKVLAVRAEHVAAVRPRYMHVVDALSKALRHFLEFSAEGASDEERLRARRLELQRHLNEDWPGNHRAIESLLRAGYSDRLWAPGSDVSLVVTVEARGDAEASLRSSLVGVWGEYVDILERLGVARVRVADGTEMEPRRLWANSDYVALDDLRTRRRSATDAINRALASKPEEDAYFFRSRATALLAREDALEATAERERRRWEPSGRGGDAGTKTFVLRLNHSFFACSSCCGPAIVGCYAPQGDHAEKPVENALSARAAFVSLYERGDDGADSDELENAEILLSDSAAIVLRAYSTGHAADTSPAWVAFLRELVCARYVPALVVPRDHPTRAAFALLAEHVQPQVASSRLEFRDEVYDGQASVDSYYDTPTSAAPSMINEGDIVLTPENASAVPSLQQQAAPTSGGRRSLLKSSSSLLPVCAAAASLPSSRIRRDVCGTVVAATLSDLGNADHFRDDAALVRAFGRPISHLVRSHVDGPSCGGAEFLSSSFDPALWNGPLPDVLSASQTADSCVHRHIRDVVLLRSASETLAEDRDLFLEIRALCERWSRSPQLPACLASDECASRALELRQCMERSVRLVDLRELALHERESMLRWAFRNEDRVWRARGGRPEYESLSDFLSIARGAIPGFVVRLGSDATADPIAYCVGEFLVGDDGSGRVFKESDNTYEVVTAWVDERCRGTGLSMRMYSALASVLPPSASLICDARDGSAPHVLGLGVPVVSRAALSMVRAVVRPSYKTSTGEQFIRYELGVRAVRIVLALRSLVGAGRTAAARVAGLLRAVWRFVIRGSGGHAVAGPFSALMVVLLPALWKMLSWGRNHR
eukprot:m51a1_g6348 putative C-tail anchored protein (1629) ;mRNA; r:72962-79031